jgi:putative oxidoreductase
MANSTEITRLEPILLAALRIVAGVLFLAHGLVKLFGFPSGAAPGQQALLSLMGIGAVIELVTGTLIALGLFTRPAAFVIAGQMAVAYFQFHWKLSFSDWKFMPMVNAGELAAVFCFVFLFISAHGAGPHSLDARRNHA